MFYIHQLTCISPQQTFNDIDLEKLHEPADKKLQAIEPSYEHIPAGMLRRMGKAVRMGVGAALPLLQGNPLPDGIILGTANGGKEDCVKFLNQIIEYNEGMLTPLNFVQGTPNAVASQIGILTKNLGYNITHMHLGLAFENVLTDADMLITDKPSHQYLLGAVDDISTYNYYFEDKAGWYKKDAISSRDFYEPGTAGSVAGEAAVMFIANGRKEDAIAKVLAVDTLHNREVSVMKEKLNYFIASNLPAGEKIDILLSGENGDIRLQEYFNAAENIAGDDVVIARYKHLSGEFPTATAVGLWLGCMILGKQYIPAHMIKKQKQVSGYKNILLYNNYKGNQHSFILISLP